MASIADFVDEIFRYEKSLDNFPGLTKRKQAIVVKRFQSGGDYVLRLQDADTGSVFNLKCPVWVYEKSRPNTRLEIVYEMVMSNPHELYKEKLLL